MKFKESYIKILVMVTILAMFVFGIVIAVGDPGTATDPLVSQSYVDSKVLFQSKDVLAGKKIVLKKGAELILDTGSARVETDAAVINLSTGRTLATGVEIPANNVITSKVDNATIAIITAGKVLVKGQYAIQ